MTANVVPASTFALGDVVTAVTTMRTGNNDAKKKAHEFLEVFQKSVSAGQGWGRTAWGESKTDGWERALRCRWTDVQQKDAWTHALQMLKSKAEPEVQLFAALTLQGKVRSLVPDA